MAGTQFHIDALKAKISAAMLNSDALWATDIDGLAEVAVAAIGEWMDEPMGLPYSDPFTTREKWLRLYFHEVAQER